MTDSAAYSPAPTPAATDERLLGALRIAAGIAEHDSAALRDAVFAFVVRAKEQQRSPQEVLIGLKAHVQRAASRSVEASEYHALVARVVQWGIDEYYRGQ